MIALQAVASGLVTPLPQRVGWWSHALFSMARRGLHYSRDPHDRANFARLLTIAAEMRAAADDAPLAEVETWMRDVIVAPGPLPVADAAVFDAQGRVLLVRRVDDGLWAMPGGGLDVGETAAQGACREAWEETGLTVRAIAMVGVYDSRFCGSRSSWQVYHFVFLCVPVSGELTPSHETTDVRWFDPDDLPPLSPGHATRLAGAIAFYRSATPTAFFDL